MSQVTFKRGTSQTLKEEPITDGLLSFTTDDGKIHLDFIDEQGNLTRKTFYSGKLTIGSQVYDGSEDVSVTVYEGSVQEEK